MFSLPARGKNAYLLAIKMLLIVSGLFLTNHAVLKRLEYFLEFDLYFPLFVFLSIWAVTVAAILYVAFTPNENTRIFWVIPIGLSTLLGESYFVLMHDHMTVARLDEMWGQVASAAAHEIQVPGQTNVGASYFINPGILRALMATAILVAGLLIQPPPVKLLKFRIFSLVPMIPWLLLTGLIHYVAETHGNQTKGMPSQFYSLGLITIYTLSEKPSLEKSEVGIALKAPSELRHIILIVDESVSGDFIDLNVPRGTTPYLASPVSSVLNFGLAVSASNCSNESNAIMRLGANPKTLGKKGLSILNNPSIWKYASAAGFETSFVDMQEIVDRKDHYVNDLEISLIDNHLEFPPETNSEYRDREALNHLRGILRKPTPQFVYVNKRGIHAPYRKSYPGKEAVFTPVMEANESIENRKRLVNTYKNGIRWSVDNFLQILIEEIGLDNSVIIYTSDHGQNLLDDGKPVTHCRRIHQSLNEAIVPLLVWTDRPDLQKKFRTSALLNHNAASHFEIFPTILGLFGYDPQSVRQRYHQSLFEKIDEPLGFTSGPILGRFGTEPEWNSREGLEGISR